jgi:zinc/manganese transport system substrate-binding protein
VKKYYKKLLVSFVALLIVGLIVLGARSLNSVHQSNGQVLQVVAGENFWGSLVSQIGGSKVKVDSIVSDPNADPHEYETNNADARAFATANYVILNGAGYDSWGDKLIAASPNSKRLVLNVATCLVKKMEATLIFGIRRAMSTLPLNKWS